MLPTALSASDSWNALVYGEAHPSTLNFLQNQITQAKDLVIGAGRALFDRASQAFNQYNSSDAINFARRINQEAYSSFEVKGIVEMSTLAHFQNANTLMQRWMMACPDVRQRWMGQRCDGWSSSYIDTEPGAIGESHYDYRRVNDGIVVFDEEDNWHSVQYLDELKEGDRHLTLSEQLAIKHSWLTMEALFALGKDDPTSSVGGVL